jgi:hypothetical protein
MTVKFSMNWKKYIFRKKVKDKAIPVTGRGGP